MKCQACGKHEATIHYFESVDGNTKTLNLCVECAQEQGVAQVGFPIFQVQPLESNPAVQMELVLHGEPTPRDPNETCVACGKTLADYRHDSTHACPACHDSFATLGELKRRLKRGVPARETLKAQLDQAVAEERYEDAARLRDLMRQMPGGKHQA